MNKEQTKKRKLNVIDIAVILIIIAGIIGLVVRFGSSMTDAAKTDVKFQYTVKVEGVRQYTVDALQKMGNITDKKSEKIVGKIIDVQVEDALFNSTTATGDIVETMLPDRFNCIVIIEAIGKESDDAYYSADETELSVGRTIDIYSKYVQTSGSIKNVTVIQ